MRDSSIAALEELSPAILKGKLPKFSSLSARKAAHIVRHLREYPGARTAAALGALVDWSPQHTRVVLGALGLRGGRKGYEWKVEQKEEV